MKVRLILSGFVFAALLNFKCQKEVSLEDGGGTPGGGGNPPLGNNCKVDQVITADSATGIGLYSLATQFNSAGKALKVEAFDSTTSTSDLVINLGYSGDTIRVSANEYFLQDASGRIQAFHTYQDPADVTSEQITYTYNYNAGGYLETKDISLASVPFPVVQFTYTWSGGNLVKVDGVIPGINQKVLTANLEYDGSKTAKNFIPIFPDGFELAPYIMAFNLGRKSTNLVNKITLEIYNESGGLDQTLVTSFKNFVFSSDGYLLEWYAQGDQQSGAALLNGRTKFHYFCN